MAFRQVAEKVDLIRAGEGVLAIPSPFIPAEWRNDYLACIRRSWRGNDRELDSIPLRKRLPVHPIPLRSHEPPVRLALQRSWGNVIAWADTIGKTNREAAKPPRSATDQAWVEETLKSVGKRQGRRSSHCQMSIFI